MFYLRKLYHRIWDKMVTKGILYTGMFQFVAYLDRENES